MTRNPVALVWIAGLVLAFLVYEVGPDGVSAALVAGLDALDDGIRRAIHDLSSLSFDLVRALAIGLYATFVALSVMAVRAGHRGRVGLVVVSFVFLLLVWTHGGPASGGRWVSAMILCGVASLVMTGRLGGARGLPGLRR